MCLGCLYGSRWAAERRASSAGGEEAESAASRAGGWVGRSSSQPVRSGRPSPPPGFPLLSACYPAHLSCSRTFTADHQPSLEVTSRALWSRRLPEIRPVVPVVFFVPLPPSPHTIPRWTKRPTARLCRTGSKGALYLSDWPFCGHSGVKLPRCIVTNWSKVEEGLSFES